MEQAFNKTLSAFRITLYSLAGGFRGQTDRYFVFLGTVVIMYQPNKKNHQIHNCYHSLQNVSVNFAASLIQKIYTKYLGGRGLIATLNYIKKKLDLSFMQRVKI